MNESLKRETDFLKELIETENQLSQQTLQVLRNRYRNEKDQWSKIYENKEEEINNLRGKLNETEVRIKRLKDNFTQDRLEEVEKLKNTITENKVRKLNETEKWNSIEDRVKTFRSIAEELQFKLIQEQASLTKFRERHIAEEKTLRDLIAKNEEKILSLQETLLKKEDDWSKQRQIFDKELVNLQDKIKNYEQVIQNQKQNHLKIVADKDEGTTRISRALQEVSVKLTEEIQKNEELKHETQQKANAITELEQLNKKNHDEISAERKKWHEKWEIEQREWENYKRDLIEKEQTLKFSTEEQISRVSAMLQILELQLTQEKKTNEELTQRNSDKEGQIKLLMEELDMLQKITEEQRQKLDLQIAGQKDYYENQKNEILAQYENYKKSKENDTQRINAEILELRASLNEEERLFQLEKTQNQTLKYHNEMLKEDKHKLVVQIDQDRIDWRRTFIEEQSRSESRIQEITGMLEKLRVARDEEIKGLNSEIETIHGQFNELRIIYQETKVENYTQKSRIYELEAEVQKLLEQSDSERKEWQSLLNSEQKNWESHKNELLTRQNALMTERDREMKQIERSIQDLTMKLIHAERDIQTKDKEIAELLKRINFLENRR
ncbi:MAG: hypothetical protein A2252_10945 [Elusimicrobia bacterium RIFOXYA2_FULL_39_19]|nr:MAG: hypothetical protein A2252_10945 [Elusimicrobia bacterium RIFOXYA2_FULL_39_19]